MAVVGTAWVAVKAKDDGSFEASLIKDVKQAAAAAEAGAKITPVVNTSKATGPLDLLKSKLTSFAGSGSPVTKALGDITTASGGAEGALAGVATGGLAIAGAAAVAFAAKSVGAFQQYTAGVRAVQRTTATSAEDASKLAYSFRMVGIAPEAAASSLGRFARNLDTMGPKLGALGVEVRKNADGTTNMKETFLNVADAIAKAKDPTDKLNLAMTAFGRGGQALLPILGKGREGIEGLFGEAGKHGQIFSQKDLDTGKELTLAWRSVKETIQGVFITVGKYIAPFVLDIVNIIQGVIELGQKFTIVKDIIKVALAYAFAPLIGIVKAVDLLSKAVDFLTGKHQDHKKAAADDADAMTDAADGADELAGAETTAAKAAEDAAKAEKTHTDQLKTLKDQLTSVTDAQQSLTDAKKHVTEASEREGTAQAKLTALRAAGTIDLDKLKSATDGLASAQKSSREAAQKAEDAQKAVGTATQGRTDALDRQAVAQKRVNDLISGQAAAEDMVAHRHDLEHATLSVRSAQASLTEALKAKEEVTNRVATAEAKLAALRAGHTATQKDLDDAAKEVQDAQATQADDLAAAQLRVDEATLSVAESQESLVDTQKALNDIQNEGQQGSKVLEQANKDLAAANRDVDSATQAVSKAQRDAKDAADDLVVAQAAVITKTDELNKAQQPDAKLIADIKTAEKDVKDAHDGVRDAARDAAQKAGDLATKMLELKNNANKSLPDLQAVKGQLQDIVNLQPGALAYVQPTLDAINVLITAAQSVATAQITGATNLSTKYSSTPLHRTGGVQAYASGGYASGSFTAGESGPELISLRPGGGAMVYAAETPESRLAGGGVMIPVTIEAHFGPGTNADDVVAAMRSIAQGELSAALNTIANKLNAGPRR